MIRPIGFLFLLVFLAQMASGQTGTRADTLAGYFAEIKEATARHRNLWNRDLYGPVLLVEPMTRRLYASHSDTGQALQKAGRVFTGTLPKRVNIANAALDWGGRRWAMVMLPLPQEKAVRLNLLAHELFHRLQPELGFSGMGPASSHLDGLIGRVYLRLELEALKKALLAGATDRKTHLANAMAFRAFRQAQFQKADSIENLLELNEGLAEFTGLMMSGRDPDQVRTHLAQSLSAFVSTPTYVRSFAYQTVPAYGFLLSRTQKQWNRQVNQETSLTAYFQNAFGIELPADLGGAVRKLSAMYGGETIVKEENDRQDQNQRALAGYRTLFVEEPHLDLPLEKTNMSFDPRNLVSLDDFGIVYPGVRLTDTWGILTVAKGALISADGKTVTVSPPTEITEGKAVGDGWTLEFSPGYRLEKEGEVFRLKK